MALTKVWWEANKPKEWGSTGIGSLLDKYQTGNTRVTSLEGEIHTLEANFKKKSPAQQVADTAYPKKHKELDDSRKTAGHTAWQALTDVRAALTKWRKQKPVSSTALDGFASQVEVGISQLKAFKS